MNTDPTPQRKDLLVALGLTAVLFLLAHGQALFDPWVVNDDTRQQVFWMQHWQDPELYQGDWLADYARRYVTWGVQAVYRAASVLVPPLQFSKLLAGLEFIALGGLLFALGRGSGGRAAGWAVLCLYWLSPFFLHTISGGLARSFGAPLMVLFWLSWQQGRIPPGDAPHPLARLGLLASLLLLGLFLPYIYALCALALGLGWLVSRTRAVAAPPAPWKWWDYAVVLVSALPVLLYNQELAGSGFGPMATAAQMQADPVFGPLGRFPIMPVPSLLFELVARPLERLLPFREWGPAGGLAAGACLALLIWKGAQAVDWRLLARRLQPLFFLLAASLALYFAARLLLLALFIPSRYLEYTSNLAYVAVGGILAGAFLRRWLSRPWMAACAVLLCLAAAGVRLHGEALHDYGADAPLYQAVRQTPKDALYAGHPYAMDNVLTFGRRSVLASYELAHPWSRGLWTRLQPRLEAMLETYYARDPETVERFCQTWNVDYIVVDEAHFSRAFLLPQRQLVPVCQAPMPETAHAVCKALGLDFTVTVWHGKRSDAPGDHPMFEPYGSRLARLARPPGEFALLDRETFPGREVREGLWLLDMRHRENPASSRDSNEE